jgi:hypothetical protein
VIEGSSPTTTEDTMASSGKKKTTMAKLNRESRLRERRLDKQARKDARKFAAASNRSDGALTSQNDESTEQGAGQAPRDGAVPADVDA